MPSPRTPRPSTPVGSYLYWFLPGMALQFALVAMSSALRGTGIVKPTMIVQMATVLLNVVLAPVLIAGWGTGRGLGVAGAGLASTIAVAAGALLLFVYFRRLEKYVAVDRAQWAPRLATWRRMLGLGFKKKKKKKKKTSTSRSSTG